MKIFYRISDGSNPKTKPEYVTKFGVLHHFCKIFANHTIYIVADNVTDSTYEFIKKYINENNIFRTSLKNSGAFLFCVDLAINNFGPEEKIYFAEDDYIYTEKASSTIEEGLDIADYVSGYDHPDKYVNTTDSGDNPYIIEGGELTRVIISKSHHWKHTNGFCMTFGAKVKTIKKDLEIIKFYCQNTIPNDFGLFQELSRNHGRKLITPIPSVCTHGETKYLAPFIDWEKQINLTNHDLIQ